MLVKLLSKKDATTVLDIIHASVSCRTEELFKRIVLQLQNLIPFEHSICAFGTIRGLEIASYRIVNVSYPSKWLELYTAKRYEKIDPIVKEHISSFTLQYWADTYKKYSVDKEFISIAEDFNLKNGYTIGLRNEENGVGSIFTISGNRLTSNARTVMILDLVAPHFHQALMRFSTSHKTSHSGLLSKREKEVLKWQTYGKTSYDISAILKISERTVNYHFSNIMVKLNAVNRSQALAIALDEKLIQFE